MSKHHAKSRNVLDEIEKQPVILSVTDKNILKQIQLVNLSIVDLQLIKAVQPLVKKNMDALIKGFYESVYEIADLRLIIDKYSSIEKLKETLETYIIEFFAGTIDNAFLQKRLRVAKVHFRIGLKPSYYMGAFQNLLNHLTQILFKTLNDAERTDLTVEAIGKAASLEQQIVLEAYQDEFFAEEQRQKEIMRYKAYHDELTGLPNRRMAGRTLASATETGQTEKSTFSVMELNIDHFKIINDSLGHAYGDEFLRMVSRRIISGLNGPGRTDIARMGSDEFNIICYGLNKKEMAALAKQIIHAVREPYRLKDSDFYVTASIGISIFPDHGTDPVQLLKNAETAMYEAKKNGRNDYEFYTSELAEKVLERVELEGDLRKAVGKNELIVHYQPQIRTDDHSLIGMEALVRWNRRSKEILSPGVFIPVAEETGIIHEIGMWVLKEACVQMRKWHDEGGPLIPISVNLSTQHFHDQCLVEHIKKILGEARLDPHYLELEITESVMADNVKLSMEMLNELRRMGIKISLDDFGTGYSSFTYLKNFPIDRLKIDRSFIVDITTNERDKAIVAAIISMAKHLKLGVIAEGIETKDQLDVLDRNQCNEIQGYYFSRPLPAQEVEKVFLNRTGRA